MLEHDCFNSRISDYNSWQQWILWFLYISVLFLVAAFYTSISLHHFDFSVMLNQSEENQSPIILNDTHFFSPEYDVIGLWVQTVVITSEGSTHNAQFLQTDKNPGPSLHRQEEKDSFQIHLFAMPHIPPKHICTPLTPTNAQSLYPAHATFVPTSSATLDHLVKHIQIFPCQNHSVMWR